MNWRNIKWKRELINPFIITPLITLLFGNFSLGFITAGFTVLVWGFEIGMLFISITTVLLVLLTGNINFEIIFVYSISLAFLIKKGKLLKQFDRKLLYYIFAVVSISLYPLWSSLLGIIPAGLLNEFNISGQILLIGGLFLTLVRGKIIINRNTDVFKLLNFVLVILCAILGVMGNFMLIPVWITGIYLVNVNKQKLCKQVLPLSFYNSVLFMIITTAVYILLPVNIFISTLLIILFCFLFWYIEEVPLLEMVYLSVILGIFIGRLGLLS
ncbi:MAG: hypothetical protein ACOCRZ_00840 [Halothermotrichaceae bacterium]